MKDYFRRFPISTPDVKHLRILVHGPVGAGKSSFINSIDSIFQERITTGALAETATDHSFTKTFQTHMIKDQNYGSFVPFVICDIMGLEGGQSEGVETDDLIKVLQGHIKDYYTFNPTSPCSENDYGYNSSPKLSDRIHCLLSVIPATNISNMDEAVIEKMKAVRAVAGAERIPQVAVLTKVDEMCPWVAEDTKLVYRSKKIKEKMQMCSNRLGVPMNCMFPVKCYHEEIDLNDDVDVLLLCALNFILNAANDHVAVLAAENPIGDGDDGVIETMTSPVGDAKEPPPTDRAKDQTNPPDHEASKDEDEEVAPVDNKAVSESSDDEEDLVNNKKQNSVTAGHTPSPPPSPPPGSPPPSPPQSPLRTEEKPSTPSSPAPQSPLQSPRTALEKPPIPLRRAPPQSPLRTKETPPTPPVGDAKERMADVEPSPTDGDKDQSTPAAHEASKEEDDKGEVSAVDNEAVPKSTDDEDDLVNKNNNKNSVTAEATPPPSPPPSSPQSPLRTEEKPSTPSSPAPRSPPQSPRTALEKPPIPVKRVQMAKKPPPVPPSTASSSPSSPQSPPPTAGKKTPPPPPPKRVHFPKNPEMN